MLNIRTAILLVLFVAALALTARTAVVTEVIVGAASVGDQSTSERTEQSECASLPSRYSLHVKYIEETGRWVSYTEDGPTGVDGGLIHLLSAYRTCP